MICYIHIGLEKTGTTTIQQVLRKNEAILHSKNICYPDLTIQSRIQVLGYIEPNPDDVFSMVHNITTKPRLQEFQEKLSSDIKQVLDLNPQKDIVFSHELIQSRLTQRQQVLHFKENLEQLGFSKFKIIVYIRNQADLFASMVSQSLKNGLQDDWSFLHAPGTEYSHFVCNHKQTLQWWAYAFGRDSMEVRIFDRKEFVDNDLMSDFLHILGLNTKDFVIDDDSNVSLSVFGAALCRRINSEFPWFIDGKFNRQRAMLTGIFNRHFSYSNDGLMGKKFMLAKDVYASYLEYYKECNEWVQKEFFPDRAYLFKQPDMSKYEENYEVDEAYSYMIENMSKCIIDIAKKVPFPNQATNNTSNATTDNANNAQKDQAVIENVKKESRLYKLKRKIKKLFKK